MSHRYATHAGRCKNVSIIFSLPAKFQYLQIIWILRSIGYSAGGAQSSTRAVNGLIGACHDAAMRMLAGKADAMSNECHESKCMSFAGILPGEHHSCPGEGSNSAQTRDHYVCRACHVQHLHGGAQVMLQGLRNELSSNDVVPELVQANQNAGGHGVVAPGSNGVSSELNHDELASKQLNAFEATLQFFDSLCSSGQGLTVFKPTHRHSILRQRLEKCNELLYTQALMSKV